MDDQAKKLISARISDLSRESERGYMTCSGFLDPAEIFFIKEQLNQTVSQSNSFFFGGYDGAERQCLFFIPHYYEEYLSQQVSAELLCQAFGNEISEHVKMLKISGSGYKTLTHRDYLGAILNMGIDRSALGDICITDESSCAVFAMKAVAELILFGLERIGADKVKISEVTLTGDFVFEKKTRDISDTVASDRADCVVSSLAGESREKAKSRIMSGLVECNYSTCLKADMRIKSGDTLSIRGVGKFVISDITEETKKGRLRLYAKKYI